MELKICSFSLYLQHGRRDVKCKPSIRALLDISDKALQFAFEILHNYLTWCFHWVKEIYTCKIYAHTGQTPLTVAWRSRLCTTLQNRQRTTRNIQLKSHIPRELYCVHSLAYKQLFSYVSSRSHLVFIS